MSIRKNSIHGNGGHLREVAPSGLLGLVAIPSAEKQVAAESDLEHVCSIVGLAANENGKVIGHIVRILNDILISIGSKSPVGETVDLSDMSSPLVDNLDVFLSEVPDGSCVGFGVFDLAYLDFETFGNVAALDNDLAVAGLAAVL